MFTVFTGKGKKQQFNKLKSNADPPWLYPSEEFVAVEQHQSTSFLAPNRIELLQLLDSCQRNMTTSCFWTFAETTAFLFFGATTRTEPFLENGSTKV